MMEARSLNHPTQRSDIVIYILILFTTTTLKSDITMIYLHGMIVSFVVNVPVVLLDMFVVIVDMIVDIMNILVKKCRRLFRSGIMSCDRSNLVSSLTL